MNPIPKVILSLPQSSQRFQQRAQWLKNNVFILCEPCEFFAFFAVKILFRMDTKSTLSNFPFAGLILPRLFLNSPIFHTFSIKNHTIFAKINSLRNPIKIFFDFYYSVYQSNRNFPKINFTFGTTFDIATKYCLTNF